MASSLSKANLLRNVARSYSAQAAPKVDKKSFGVETTTLSNKLFVASVNNNSPIARISITFRAGSRNEGYDELGSAHLLRVAAGLSNKNSSVFGIIRNLQQIGGSLSCTGDRETISYTVELTRDNLDTGLKYLSDVTTAQVFKPWEIEDSLPRLKVELGQVSDQVLAIELLHKASFKTGLGNSIFCPSHQVGKISSETLQHFVNNLFTASRASVSATGIAHNTILGFAQNLKLGSSEGSDAKSQYRGSSEVRVDKSGNWAHVAIGAEGVSLQNAKEALAASVLRYAAGAGPSTKRGQVNGTIGKSVTSAMGDNAFGFNSINASYSDSGLVGFILSAEASKIGKGIDAAVKALKSGSVSDADVARGKAQLKVDVLSKLENDASLVEDLGQQGALFKSIQNKSAILSAIDGLSASDVNAVARKAASGKLSIGAVGNLRNVPYIDQL